MFSYFDLVKGDPGLRLYGSCARTAPGEQVPLLLLLLLLHALPLPKSWRSCCRVPADGVSRPQGNAGRAGGDDGGRDRGGDRHQDHPHHPPPQWGGQRGGAEEQQASQTFTGGHQGEERGLRGGGEEELTTHQEPQPQTTLQSTYQKLSTVKAGFCPELKKRKYNQMSSLSTIIIFLNNI